MNGEGGAVFKSYTVKNGLPSDILLSVEEDDTGSLWISTENGLSKFIPSNNVLRIIMKGILVVRYVLRRERR